MKREDLITSVKDIIGQALLIPVDGLELDTRLADLDIDSLEMIKVALALEVKFKIVIATNELARIVTFGDIIDGLERKLELEPSHPVPEPLDPFQWELQQYT